MKKIITFMMFAVIATSVFAQEQGKIRGSINIGLTAPVQGFGLCSDLQLGYNLTNNMTAGIKGGGTLMVRMPTISCMAEFAGNFLCLGTFTYFYPLGAFVLYGGIGLGAYPLWAFAEGTDNLRIDVHTKFGGMLTGGFEIGIFKMGFEYNLIPKWKKQPSAFRNIPVENTYLAATIGVRIGGGRWKKN